MKCQPFWLCWHEHHQAYEWGNTRKSYWRTADSPILHRAISNDNLRKAGYATFIRVAHKIGTACTMV